MGDTNQLSNVTFSFNSKVFIFGELILFSCEFSASFGIYYLSMSNDSTPKRSRISCDLAVALLSHPQHFI
jgi:hypothetical protein